MTTDEKNKALEMKRNGVSIREIEKALNVGVSTLHYLFERSDDNDVYFLCPQCGKETVRKKTKGRPIKFCSRECGIKYKSIHRPRQRTYICKYCGKNYKQESGKKTLFCSRACYLNYRYGDKRISHSNS